MEDGNENKGFKTYSLLEISEKLDLKLNTNGYPMSAWRWCQRMGLKPFGDFRPARYLQSEVDGLLRDLAEASRREVEEAGDE